MDQALINCSSKNIFSIMYTRFILYHCTSLYVTIQYYNILFCLLFLHLKAKYPCLRPHWCLHMCYLTFNVPSGIQADKPIKGFEGKAPSRCLMKLGLKRFMLIDKHNNQSQQIHSKKHVNVFNVARLIIAFMTCANINPDIL